jgi:hypothetical protein
VVRSGGVGVPLNTALEGKTYPEISFRVDEDHVRRFAAAVGDDGAFVPPTFFTAPEILSGLDRVVADEELGLDFARVVHGDEEFQWRRAVRVGETLQVQTVVESIRAKGGHEFLVLRTDMRDAAGEEVVVTRSTMIVRGNG